MKKHNETNLKEAIQGMLDLYKLRGKYQQTRIRQLWPSVDGNIFHCLIYYRIKVHRNKLFVTISSAPLKQELVWGRIKSNTF
ncbi:MAG: hypothetical protein R2795_23535 [Saprospiraceae bacterium]